MLRDQRITGKGAVTARVRMAKGRIGGYTWGKRDVCPDCMDAVQSFFNTDKFQHTCKTCGDALQICESH